MLADAATLAIGPIETEVYAVQDLLLQRYEYSGDIECNLTTTEVADFLAGFVYGFTGDNWQSYFETCFHDTPAFEASVCTAINDIATKDNQQVAEGIHILLSDMPDLNSFLAACPNA